MSLRNVVSFVSAAVLCVAANAAEVGVHLASWHSEKTAVGEEYNNSNPGMYVVADNGLTAGFYRNSLSDKALVNCTYKFKSIGQTRAYRSCNEHREERWSSYVGYTANTEVVENVQAEVTVGLITGYPIAKVLPFVTPSIRIGGDTAVRISYMPPVGKIMNTHVLHLSVSVKF